MATSEHFEEPGTSAHYEEPIETFPEILQKVASCISKDWQWLGRNMGFKEPELNNLSRHFHLDGPKEIAYQMLLQWQERQGMAATVNLLAQHLQAVHRVDLSHKVLKMAKESNKSPNILPMPIIKSTGTPDEAIRCKQKKVTRSPSSSSPPARKEDAWESIKSMLQIEHSRLEIPKMPWLEEEWETGFDDYYVDLTISTKNKDATPLQLHEIFDSVEQGSKKLPTRILIEGPAGFGKSTLAGKLCFDHAKAKDYIRHFDAVILLRLREFSGTLEEMIIDRYELPVLTCSWVSEFLSQRKMLFVLDGFDELQQNQHPHVTPLLKGKQYPQSTVIVTSRMGCMKLEGGKPGSSVTNLLHCVTSRISIVGVTGENRVAFLQQYLKGYSSEKCAAFIKSTDTKFGLSEGMKTNLFDCPLYLLLLVTVAEETDLASLRSKTQLYKHLFNFILRRLLAKEGQVDQTCNFFEFSHENRPAYVDMLSGFGSLAGEALRKEQYTFTEEEILRACGNDGTILKLGILTRNDSKTALRRKLWFEPIHLSFLEFAFAYSVWIGCVSTHPFLCSLHSVNMIHLHRLLWRQPVSSFVCGLCWKQLPTLLSAFTQDYRAFLGVMMHLDHAEMMIESQLELSELGKSFLPLVPVECIVVDDLIREAPPILVKEALMHAVQTRRDQRIILEHQECTAAEQHQGSWLKVTTRLDASQISQDWRKLATSQNIVDYDHILLNFSFTLCEAPLQQQLDWLSHFMTIEGVLQNKPIHTIWYECPREKVPKLVDLMTDLIQQERVVAVRLVMGSACPCAESWKEFIRCANESKELLDMSLQNWTSSPLVVDLTPAEGKRWRKVELYRNIVVSVGSQLVDVSELNKYDLDSLGRRMPSNVQTLQIFGIRVFRNDNLPTAHNVEELVITFKKSNLSLVQPSVWESLKNLKVLTIYMEPDSSTHDITTFLLSVIFHSHSPVRVQLGRGCTEQLIATFLDRLHKEKWPTSSDRGESVPTGLHLNTLIIPADDNESVLTSSTANLVKEALQTGCIERLWVRCGYFYDGCTVKKFIESFSPAEFNMKAVEKQLWPKYNKWGTRCLLEVYVN